MGGVAVQPHDPLCPGSSPVPSIPFGGPPFLSTLSETLALPRRSFLACFPSWRRPTDPTLWCICCFPASPKGGWLHRGEIWGVCSFKLIQAPAAAHSRPSGKTHRGTDGTWPAFSPFLAAFAQCWPLLEASLKPAGAQPRGPAPAPGPGLVSPQTELLSLHLEQLPRAAQAWWPHSRPHLALHSGLTVTNVPLPL